MQSEDEVKFQIPRLRVPPSQETTPCVSVAFDSLFGSDSFG